MGLRKSTEYKCVDGHYSYRTWGFCQPAPREINCDTCNKTAQRHFDNKFVKHDERCRHVRNAGIALEEGNTKQAGEWLKELP